MPDGSFPTVEDLANPATREILLKQHGLTVSLKPADTALKLLVGPESCRIALVATRKNQFSEIDIEANGAVIDNVWHPVRPADKDQTIVWLNTNGFKLGPCAFADVMALRSKESQAPCQVFYVQDGKESTREVSLDGLITNATPYPYQVKGINYLTFMKRSGVGCVLADEMGLGKTLQIIGFLLLQKGSAGKSIVIAPATLVENWRRELSKFAPSLKVIFRTAGRRDFELNAFDDCECVVTSYDTAVTDIGFLSRFDWENVILDEAQYIKNPNANRTKSVKRLRRKFSVAVSGTPFENHLTDTWSLTDFVFEGYLGRLREFEARFAETLEDAETLSWVLEPLILRRLVKDVAKDLPERIDIPVFFDPPQMLVQAQDEILARVKATGNMLPEIQNLRTLAAHANEQAKLSASPKFEYLKNAIWEILSRNEKALIFTSFNNVSQELSEWLQTGWATSYVNAINGSTKMKLRQTIIDEFTNAKNGVLVLNPQAAGVGLNITAASHVFHFNPEWNPSLTEQASKRAHRNGQKLPVTVHYMFYSRTIEELVASSQEFKLAIGKALVPGVLLPLSEKAAIKRLTEWGKS